MTTTNFSSWIQGVIAMLGATPPNKEQWQSIRTKLEEEYPHTKSVPIVPDEPATDVVAAKKQYDADVESFIKVVESWNTAKVYKTKRAINPCDEWVAPPTTWGLPQKTGRTPDYTPDMFPNHFPEYYLRDIKLNVSSSAASNIS